MESSESESAEAPRSTSSWVRSGLRPSGWGPVVVVMAAAPDSSSSWRTVMPASFAAFSRASFWACSNQPGTLMTAPWTFLPRKSSADWMRDFRKMVVTSETVRIRSA